MWRTSINRSLYNLANQSLHTSRRLATTYSPSQANPQSTVNADEVAFFSKLSSLWWDEKGEFGMLHKMNPIRMQFVREKLVESAYEDNMEASINEAQVLQGLDVLDVGCGGGLLSESLARLGANTLGIDATPSNINIATLHASVDPALSHDKVGGKAPLTYKHTTVEDLLAERGPNSFDVVCSMEVLEHVDNPRSFLSSCAELVKPGGHLFLSTIARTPLAYFLTIFAAEDVLRLVSRGTHTFSKYVNPEELEGFFRSYRTISPSASSDSISGSGIPLNRTSSERHTKPWISRPGPVSRIEAETRGIMYVPWRGEWVLAPRGSKWAEGCNYLFWVRKPIE